MNQFGQLLQGVFQDLIQRSGRTGQAGNAAQPFGALGPLPGLQYQVRIFNDRRGLIGNNRQQADFIL